MKTSFRLEQWMDSLGLTDSERRFVVKGYNLYGYIEAVQIALCIHKENKNRNTYVEIPKSETTQTSQTK